MSKEVLFIKRQGRARCATHLKVIGVGVLTLNLDQTFGTYRLTATTRGVHVAGKVPTHTPDEF